MALSGHPTCTDECPLSGVKQIYLERAVMLANDPKRTFTLLQDEFGNDEMTPDFRSAHEADFNPR